MEKTEWHGKWTGKMWAVTIGVAVFMVAVATPAVVMLAMQYDQVDTDRWLTEHASGGTAVYESIETAVETENARYIVNLLTSYGRQRVYFPPLEPDVSTGVVLHLDDTIRLHIVPNGKDSMGVDSALIYYASDAKERCYRLDDYNLVRKVTQAVSPDGYALRNAVIQP